tara:strand:+ start:1546 stop:2169 length:624 start_codon:yes stop_codon:yes gene_type:complete
MAPRQMTEHSLNAVKGWPSPHAVDYSASFVASGSGGDSGLHDTFVAFSGSVVSLNAAGKFVYGVANGAMPMFLFQNSDDPDVANDGGDALVTSGAWTAVAPTGKMMALPAAGAYELATTEVKGTIANFVPNDLLAVVATNGDAGNHADRGKVEEMAWATGAAGVAMRDVVGVVSRVGAANSHGKDEVSFWPVYLPTSKLNTSTAVDA